MTAFAYLDGQWVDATLPHLGLSTQGLQYGTAVFEGIRAYRSQGETHIRIFKAREHFKRMHASCRALRIELREGVDELIGIAEELIIRNDHDNDCYIRPVACKTTFLPGTPFGVRLSGVNHSLMLTSFPMPSRLGHPSRLGIASTRKVPDTSIPSRAKISGAYVSSALAVDECTARGYDDALLLTDEGRVAEASTSNILLRRDEAVITPSLDQGILPGVTRSLVLDIARHEGYEVIERPVELAELFSSDELLLTGTGVEISPVTSVEGREIRDGLPGSFTRLVCEQYQEITRAVR
ncbi:aminotransferase class IV [Actinomyces wuliandei]|uniref:aminotransferase class IV n=1 Tax=Actinomyces wuliandei TaxID=2057743 RepID=UPI001117DEBC|nr:aminotransferase class IV [Actinomyces wuliandei]